MRAPTTRAGRHAVTAHPRCDPPPTPRGAGEQRDTEKLDDNPHQGEGERGASNQGRAAPPCTCVFDGSCTACCCENALCWCVRGSLVAATRGTTAAARLDHEDRRQHLHRHLHMLSSRARVVIDASTLGLPQYAHAYVHARTHTHTRTYVHASSLT